jgi:hypothetical protein
MQVLLAARRPRVPRPASSPPPAGGGLSYAVLRAALHQHTVFRHRGASVSVFTSPIGHGRGLATRPGCAVPGEGIDSARRCWRSSMPGERRQVIVFCNINRRQPARLRPSPIRITPLLFSLHANCIKTAATATEISVTVAARAAPHRFSPDSTPSHPRKSSYV